MDGMERIRKCIDSILRIRSSAWGLQKAEWESIEAAIDEARPSDGEITVALRELDKAKPRARHSVQSNGDGHRMILWPGGGITQLPETIKAAAEKIRSNIPKPEPTPEEDWVTVGQHVRQCGMPVDVAAALARIRNRDMKE